MVMGSCVDMERRDVEERRVDFQTLDMVYRKAPSEGITGRRDLKHPLPFHRLHFVHR